MNIADLRSIVLVFILAALCQIKQSEAATLVGSADFMVKNDLTVITTDAGVNLEFLDLSTTAGMGVADALATYSAFGFALASDIEVAELFSAFDIEYEFVPGGVTTLTTVSDSEATNFVNYFGVTGTGFNSLGMYADASAINPAPWFCISISGCGPANFTADVLDIFEGSPIVGVTLYRVSTIPVPAAFWLFASALGLMGWTRRATSATAT